MISKNLLLTGLTLLPLTSSGNISAIAKADYSTSQIVQEETKDRSAEACTIMYVGKDVSKTGRAYIARSGDASPTGMNMNMKIFNHNELANQVIEGKNGFKWTMPSETYRYISFPRNPMMNKGLHWEVAGINENGVAVSATLSCGTNDIAKQVDPLERKTGITEDNIAQIVAATAKTAKEGIQYVANIIDQVGSGEENAIMIADKNEAWYMEMYTGHQYAAIKMPDDKITTIGNEYMLETLEEYKDVITSPDLFTLPKKYKFDKYDKDGHFHLFNTYGEEGESGTQVFNDGCHIRTWRGIDMFCSGNYPEYQIYSKIEKYPSFFKPDRKLGVDDVISYMRDRYESILEDPANANYKYFKDLEAKHRLRTVADETAYNVHIISINPDLPAETGVEEWFCLSNSKFAPFIPLSNGVTELNKYYTHVTPYYGLDEESAVCIFKRLNSLAAIDYEHYGKPITAYMNEHEAAWRKQWDQVIQQIKPLDVNKQKEVLTNYCLQAQKEALQMSNILYEDLLWHDINVTKSYFAEIDKTFKPYVSIEYYSWLYGWDYSKNGNIITLTQGSDKITIDLTYKWGAGNEGTIQLNDQTAEKALVQVRYDIPYINFNTAHKYISIGRELRNIDINDYFNKLNPLVWILPVAIGVPLIAAAITIPLVIHNKNKKHSKSKAK